MMRNKINEHLAKSDSYNFNVEKMSSTSFAMMCFLVMLGLPLLLYLFMDDVRYKKNSDRVHGLMLSSREVFSQVDRGLGLLWYGEYGNGMLDGNHVYSGIGLDTTGDSVVYVFRISGLGRRYDHCTDIRKVSLAVYKSSPYFDRTMGSASSEDRISWKRRHLGIPTGANQKYFCGISSWHPVGTGVYGLNFVGLDENRDINISLRKLNRYIVSRVE